MTNDLCRICFKNKKYVSPKGIVKYCCSDCNKILCKKWYKINQIRKINITKDYHQKTNYASEKTDKQRKLRYIKRETRRKYPLKNQLCFKCGDKATEHHHYTFPIEVDKFYYACHKCHVHQNDLMRGG